MSNFLYNLLERILNDQYQYLPFSFSLWAEVLKTRDWLEDSEVYSLDDLARVNSGELYQLLRGIVSRGVTHVIDCDLSTRIPGRKVRLVRSHLPIPTGLDCPLRQMWQLFSSVTSVRFERLSAMPTIVVATYQQNILIFVFFKKKVFNLNIYPNFKLTNIDDSLPYICN